MGTDRLARWAGRALAGLAVVAVGAVIPAAAFGGAHGAEPADQAVHRPSATASPAGLDAVRHRTPSPGPSHAVRHARRSPASHHASSRPSSASSHRSSPSVSPHRAPASATSPAHAGKRHARAHTRAQRASDDTSLRISKTVSPDPMIIGSQSVYTVTVTNSGDAAAEGVTVTDDLDPNVTPGTMPAGCSASGRTVTCGGPGTTVPADGSVTYRIPVTVDPGVSDGTNITNHASVSADNAPDASTQLISQTQTLTDVEITKTGPATANPDGTITYTIAVTDHGPSEAVDVTVEDETNGNLTTITDRPDECPGGGLTLTCPLGTLEPGETHRFTFTVRVNPDLPDGTEIENCATVYTGSRENNTANNRSCTTAEVNPSPSPTPTSPTPTPTSPTPTPTSPTATPTSASPSPTGTSTITATPTSTTPGPGPSVPGGGGPGGHPHGPSVPGNPVADSLPFTGMPTVPLALGAAALTAIGFLIRRAARLHR